MADGGVLPRTKTLLVADLFCGAGGSSTGARRALASLGHGMNLVAVNHWNIAIETHSKNHPEARHYLRDLMSADPIELVPEGRLDLLMASPTCTHHSRARGGKPSSDQQRMDPWAVVRWCSELRVKRLLVENVPEFVEWGPIDTRIGRPIKRRKGETFRAWVAALRGLGFKVEWRVINAADYGDATTRVRFFLMARSDGKRITWPAPTHSRQGGDLFGSQKWRAAREIIDWSLDGQSIYNRKRPLAPATLARIYAGAIKFSWPAPYLVVLRRHMDAQSLDRPLPSLCASGTHVGIAEPIIFPANQSRERARGIRAVSEPLPTVTATGTDLALAEPFLLNRHGDNGSARGHSLTEPMPTADCRGAGYLVEPFTLSTGSNGAPRSVDEPLCTITTGGAGNADRPGCARPMLIEPFVCGNRTNNTAKSVDEPIGGITTTTGGGQFLVEPFLATVAHGTAEGDTHDRRCRSLEDPLQTIHAGGGKFALVEPFVLSQASGGAPRGVADPVPTIPGGGAHALICPYYGSGSGETCGDVGNPLPTCTAKARFGLVVPVTQSNGGPNPRSIDEPVPTMTTAKGGEFALAMPVTHGRDGGRVRSVDEPLPTVTGAHRGELAVIVAAFGEREGQAPRVHSVDAPCPTIAAQGRIQLAQADEQTWDIRFRMLQPHELAAAMGFTGDDAAYEFAGNKTEITKQIGNAVPVNTACALVGALCDA